MIGCWGLFLHSHSSGYHQNAFKLHGCDSIIFACKVREMEYQVVMKTSQKGTQSPLDHSATRDPILDLLFCNNLEKLSVFQI